MSHTAEYQDALHTIEVNDVKVIFCDPKLTMNNTKSADVFFNECRGILDDYVAERIYIESPAMLSQLLARQADCNDILVFFTSENGQYKKTIFNVLQKYNDAQSRIWAIAMENTPECRRPPMPISNKQSFDVSCRNENRNPMKNNMKAISQIFARKIIAQTLSPLYQDEVLYFISHRRKDGEQIAAKLADALKRLTRERNVYRDVVNVEVGDDAQKDIDRNLEISDAVIFLQTKESQYSSYIMKELCFALVNDIPILWIQIDNAPYSEMEIRPGESPMLSYSSKEFDDEDRLEEIADKIEEKLFHLIMNSSNQVYSYVEYLNEMNSTNKIELTCDQNRALAYTVQYKEKTRDLYNSGIRTHYIQCFGRNPKVQDIQQFVERVKSDEIYHKHDCLFLLSNHCQRESPAGDEKVIRENYDDYLMNIENVSGVKRKLLNKRIVLSGAFPDCDEIYKNSLLEAVMVYSKEIIKRGYTLVFGAHPTFQNLIFGIGKLYSSDVRNSTEMHMSKSYIGGYNIDELEEVCTLVLADDLQEMRQNMICEKKCELLVCLGGKIKDDKSQQGVDVEVGMAKNLKIPVALVGTVGGRSSEYAYEKIAEGNWDEINSWGNDLNESLFYNVNHRLMATRLLDNIWHEGIDHEE